jgi:predicted transcriptional regulator
MTLTIELPDELAFRLMALLPEEARERFAVSAIAEALLAQESDSAECIAAVEEALAEMETGHTVSFDEEIARWQSPPPAPMT